MASLVRIGVSRLVNTSTKTLFAKSKIQLIRPISSKVIRSQDPDRPPKPKPWNYRKKAYNTLRMLTDWTTKRFDENSKIIVVEGPVAAGKSDVARNLAEELDMLYLPEANLDMVYINEYGYDLRQLDEQLPEPCRSHDIKDFLKNPKHQNTAKFQFWQYHTKYSQYVDALAHLLSTGQGVVLDRCVYSDFVFVEAMYSQGYLTKPAYKLYYEVRKNTLFELFRPHLVIYLDVPVSITQENIKKRNLACERNSQVLTPQYLSVMEKIYKQKYLKEINKHAELLIYDWSEGGEVEIIVEDIERIDFDSYDNQDSKSKDWKNLSEDEWGEWRYYFTNDKEEVMANFNVPMINVPEMMLDAEDAKLYYDITQNAPGEAYEVGFNANMGDTNILIKSRGPHHRSDTLPRRERVLQ